MNELLEKIKSMDKKTLIGIAVGAVVVIVLIIALIVGLGGDKPAVNDGTEAATEKETERATETLFETVDGTETTEVTEATEATETTEVTETELPEEGDGTTGTVVPPVVSEGGYVNGVEQLPTVLNPEGEEIMGAGSAAQPYQEIPNLSNMTVTTVAIPAGQTLYYQIQRVGGMYCTINDPDAFVIDAYGTRHDASGGSVFFQVQDALSSDFVTLQIGNKSGVAKSFVLAFSNPTGTFNNPTILAGANLVAGVVTNVAAGNSEGHWYAYAAEATGTMMFKLTGCTASTAAISVTNATTMANRSFANDAVLGADGFYYIAIDVTAGDILQINVGVNPDAMWNYPAATITWIGTF